MGPMPYARGMLTDQQPVPPQQMPMTPPPSAYARAMEEMRRLGPAWAQTENAMDAAQTQRALRRP